MFAVKLTRRSFLIVWWYTVWASKKLSGAKNRLCPEERKSSCHEQTNRFRCLWNTCASTTVLVFMLNGHTYHDQLQIRAGCIFIYCSYFFKNQLHVISVFTCGLRIQCVLCILFGYRTWTAANVSNTSWRTKKYPPTTMGARRHGQGGGALAPLPWKCCKVFCALVVTVKRSVDQLFMHYLHNFSSASGGEAH